MGVRTVYDVVRSDVANDVPVRIVRRDGYALCTMWSGKMGDLRVDSASSVYIWGVKVTDVESRDSGVWSGLVLIV